MSETAADPGETNKQGILARIVKAAGRILTNRSTELGYVGPPPKEVFDERGNRILGQFVVSPEIKSRQELDRWLADNPPKRRRPDLRVIEGEV